MLERIFKKYDCDKYSHNYAPLYELLASIKKPNSILEIGFMHGASMMSWRERFKDIELTALEININRPKKIPSNPFALVEGDFRNFNPLKKYDWIIDDGSHIGDDVYDAFHKFWDSVSSGGFYIIEDLHAGFWEEFGGSKFHQWHSFIENLISNKTHMSGKENLPSETGLVIQQKSIIAIQKI